MQSDRPYTGLYCPSGLAAATRTAAPGYSDRKWDVSGKKLAHDKIKLDPDARFTLCSTLILTKRESTRTLLHCSLKQFSTCGSGGTGRHTILRGWRRKAWGFKSPLPHQDSDFIGEAGRGPVGYDSHALFDWPDLRAAHSGFPFSDHRGAVAEWQKR